MLCFLFIKLFIMFDFIGFGLFSVIMVIMFLKFEGFKRLLSFWNILDLIWKIFIVFLFWIVLYIFGLFIFNDKKFILMLCCVLMILSVLLIMVKVLSFKKLNLIKFIGFKYFMEYCVMILLVFLEVNKGVLYYNFFWLFIIKVVVCMFVLWFKFFKLSEYFYICLVNLLFFINFLILGFNFYVSFMNLLFFL